MQLIPFEFVAYPLHSSLFGKSLKTSFSLSGFNYLLFIVVLLTSVHIVLLFKMAFRMLDIYNPEVASRYCIIMMLVAGMLYVDTTML